MSSRKKVLKVTGLTLLFIVIVVGLLSAVIFVYAHLESQNYKRDITAQVKDFNDNGESGEMVRLKFIPLAEFINPEYRKIKDLEVEYYRLYKSFILYYSDKNDYEAKIEAYNEARSKGEDPKGGEELEQQRSELEELGNELDKAIEDLKEKFNNL